MRLAVMRLAEPDDLEGALVVDVMSLHLRIATDFAGLTNQNAELDRRVGEVADELLALPFGFLEVTPIRRFPGRRSTPLCMVSV